MTKFNKMFQRMAIARMLLSGAPVFVLDEVTSALGPVTEERVFCKLMEVSEMIVDYAENLMMSISLPSVFLF